MKKSQVVPRFLPLTLLLVGTNCSFRAGVLPESASDAGGADVLTTCLHSSWCKRKAITIDTAQVSGGPTEVMLVVRIDNDSELALGTLPSGNDLRFARADGSPLLYERQAWDDATGSLIAWVHVGDIEGLDRFYLYYGNAGATDQQAGASAWPDRYAGVWHLDETTGTLADATSNANTATPNNGPALAAPGVVGAGVGFDGLNDFLRVVQSPSLEATNGNATFALWVNWVAPANGDYQRILASENRFSSTDDGYEWSAQDDGDFYLYPWGGADSYNLGPSPFTAGTWHHLAATLDFAATQVRMFIDGQEMAFTEENDSTAWTMVGMPGNWLWGSNLGLTGPFAGRMDEIQVMRGTRTPAWMRLSYANQRQGSTLLTIGPEEDLSAP
jgi:Concanavalin A-like lectin/glucanases superfamily/Domain of unknown function (DUF2341)